MAFAKSHTISENGVTGNHWQELNLTYDMKKGIVTFIVGLYVNKAAYDAGKEPILTKFFDIPEGTNPELAAAGRSFLLGYVRALPEFEGSQDVT
jgi:hypothetical protein